MRTVSTVLTFVLFGSAYGAEPPRYTVSNKVPKYTVVNRVPDAVTVIPNPALPTDPTQPAPAGHQWQKWGDGPWQLVKVAVAPVQEVRQPAPFQTQSRTTPTTPARSAVEASTGLAATYPAVGTFTLARPGTVGSTRGCTSFG